MHKLERYLQIEAGAKEGQIQVLGLVSSSDGVGRDAAFARQW